VSSTGGETNPILMSEEDTVKMINETMKGELNTDLSRKRLKIFEKITLTKSNKKKNKKVGKKQVQ
jgi:hypothetical protein